MNQKPKLLTLPHPVRLHPGLRLEVSGNNGIGITTLSADNALSLGAQLVQEAREALRLGRDEKPFASVDGALIVRTMADGLRIQIQGAGTELLAKLNGAQVAALIEAAATPGQMLQFYKVAEVSA